jgi:hypothetical protein
MKLEGLPRAFCALWETPPRTSSEIPSRRGSRRARQPVPPPSILCAQIPRPYELSLFSSLPHNNAFSAAIGRGINLSRCAPALRTRRQVCVPGSRKLRHPGAPRRRRAGSASQPVRAAPPARARRLRVRAGDSASAQETASRNLTLSRPSSMPAPAAWNRAIESGRRMFRL